jgi:hypothetical protein
VVVDIVRRLLRRKLFERRHIGAFVHDNLVEVIGRIVRYLHLVSLRAKSRDVPFGEHLYAAAYARSFKVNKNSHLYMPV